jgi:hypothetical protein
MAVKLNSLKADLSRERNGAWMPYADGGDPDLAFKVRGINSPEYEAARDREMVRLQQRFGTEPVPADERFKVLGQLLAEHILLDWKGIVDDDGAPVPYSKDLALDLLSAPEGRELRGYVIVCAQRLTEVKVEFVKDAVKNSAPPSAKN